MLRIHSLRQTTMTTPSQWEAISDDGRPVYVRYRHSERTVRVGPIGGSISEAIAATPVIDMSTGEKGSSMLSWEEVEEATGIMLIEP